jgi:methylmalonyl-CoA/ethylmalonyl-CoA epimerase
LYEKIDHVAIAVRSLESALKIYGEKLGLRDWSIEEVPSQKTRLAMLTVGESRIELLEATQEDSPVAVFIARRGEGIHHICFAVKDLELEIERLKAAGVRLIDAHPRLGAGGCRIAFIHPSSTSGVLIELSQPEPESGSKTDMD